MGNEVWINKTCLESLPALFALESVELSAVGRVLDMNCYGNDRTARLIRPGLPHIMQPLTIYIGWRDSQDCFHPGQNYSSIDKTRPSTRFIC
ncbi:hypothetical protein SDJN02_06267, partial [Cucurbita argyrosperma subsp. argyrosperma]